MTAEADTPVAGDAASGRSQPGVGADMAEPSRRRSLILFFVLTYAWAWAFWLPVVRGTVPLGSAAASLLVLTGTFAPSIVALALTARRSGRRGVGALIARIAASGVGARWFVFAALFTVVLKLSAAAVHRLAFGAWPRFGDVPLAIIPFAILLSTPVQAGEELGWRGFALPRLGASIGLPAAGILIGMIWATWHLPLFFLRGADTFGQSFPVYFLQVTAISVTMTWLYAHAKGSLLPVMLLHAAVNNSKDIVPSAAPGAGDPFGWAASRIAWITVALAWVWATYCLVRMPRPAHVSRPVDG